MNASDLARFIASGRGAEPADLVVRSVRLLDLVSGDLTPTAHEPPSRSTNAARRFSASTATARNFRFSFTCATLAGGA